MTHTTPFPTSETTPLAPSPHEPQVQIGHGWRAALGDLAGEGRRWLLTQRVNSGDTDLQPLLALMAPGDRLIIRGRPEDFRDRMSSFGAVDQFIRRGVDVRRFTHLHAKVYGREDPAAPLVWIGSANLTRRGSHGDLRGHGNYEAMSGAPTPSRRLTWRPWRRSGTTRKSTAPTTARARKTRWPTCAQTPSPTPHTW